MDCRRSGGQCAPRSGGASGSVPVSGSEDVTTNGLIEALPSGPPPGPVTGWIVTSALPTGTSAGIVKVRLVAGSPGAAGTLPVWPAIVTWLMFEKSSPVAVTTVPVGPECGLSLSVTVNAVGLVTTLS